MEKATIKRLLPEGSYKIIATRIGKSLGTVKGFFSERTETRLSPSTQEAILGEARRIIEMASWEGLELQHGLEVVRKLKQTL